MTEQIIPVILSGGSGSRLWPLSRQDWPKQLIELAGKHSMIQQTAERFSGYGPHYTEPMVICNETHRFAIAEQLHSVGITPDIILEPVGRNTAPAAAIAALHALRNGIDPLLLVVASDHIITTPEALHKAVEAGMPAASKGYLVSLGVSPDYAESGYGYIRQGDVLENTIHTVAEFVEKPSKEKAQEYVDSGDYLWNASLFLFKASTYLNELSQHAPHMREACEKAYQDAQKDVDFTRLDAAAFTAIEGDSIDYAVMEKTKKAVVVAVDGMGWSDVGSWGALWSVTDEKDKRGNVRQGDVITYDSDDCYIRAEEGPMIVTVGAKDMVVVGTKDAVLVADKKQSQNVKFIVQNLQASERSEAVHHRQVYRPWGIYESLDNGNQFQVKRLVVKPGKKLSLQKHFHRAEHWVCVEGSALVTKDGEETLLRQNESIYLPLGCVHRLENPGKIPLVIIEVQVGSYLGEDDIVRFEDTFGRA